MKRIVKYKRIITLLLIIGLYSGLAAGCAAKPEAGKGKLDPENPTTVTVWHYYNGAQQDAFNALVAEFNESVGKEKGILVEGFSQGNVTDLETSVLDAVNNKVGAGDIPNIFAAYADTAYAVDQLGLAVDLSQYLTAEEQARFIDSYLEEGRFSSDSLKIFPIAKSTEIFMLNKTDWDRFAAATGASMEELATIEGITQTARAYYEWTDSLTPEQNDGKAFFGRDAMANYMLIGAKQLGVEIFSVKDGKTTLNFDRDTMKKLWDNYYIPFIRGYFAASGRFRSDDIKTANIISFVGSSSGATFFPDKVIVNDEESYDIEMAVMQCPQFAGGEPYAVQQGAGMVVTQAEEKEVIASVEFLKWFTEDERNIRFSLASGYLPVTKTANDIERVEENYEMTTDAISNIITAAIDTVNGNTLYTTKAFEQGTNARNILEYAMSDKAAADRAVVVERLQSGMELDAAVEEFESEENFESWYSQTMAQLEELTK